jgi:hypothetical protein
VTAINGITERQIAPRQISVAQLGATPAARYDVADSQRKVPAMMRRLMGALASGVVMAFVWSASASAADDGFCQEYARAAAREVQHALDHGNCRDQMQGDRWSTDWRRHYSWCRQVSRRTAEGENAARHETLEGCAHHDHGDYDGQGHGGGYYH